jgi:hypothetical protein
VPAKLIKDLVTHLVLLLWGAKKLHRSLWIIAFTLASNTLPKIVKEVLSKGLKITLCPREGLESMPCGELLLRIRSGIWGYFSIAEKLIYSPKYKSQNTGNSDFICCHIALWVRVFRTFVAVCWIVETIAM